MVAAILLVCALNGSDCRYQVGGEGMGFSECLIQSQRIAAQYVNEHPKRTVKKVICDDHRRIGYWMGKDQA